MKLAVFDIDGTLTLGASFFDAGFIRAFALEFGFEGLSTEWNDYPHATDSGILQHVFRGRLGRAATPDEVERYKRRYHGLLREMARAGREVPGARVLLDGLAGRGWSAALATGNFREAAWIKLGFAGLDGRDLPLGSADDGEDRADILRIAVEKARGLRGKDHERVVYCGDRGWDLEAARRLGVPFVGLATGRNGAELARGRASHVLPDWSDLSRALEALEGATIPPHVRPDGASNLSESR